MTAHGVFLIFRQEFRVRLRTGRWRWLLAAWVTVILLFTALLDAGWSRTDDEGRGIPLFGGLMLFVLALVLVVSPAFTAQSINGDRERGTLATLQITRLTPLEIALGKLLAGWAVGLGALVATLPFVAWALARGGVGPVRAIVVLAVVALLMGVVCAVSLALSASLARGLTSTALSYVTVFALTAGMPIAAGLLDAAGTEGEEVWWLIAPNPFVVLADAAPGLPKVRDPYSGRLVAPRDDPLRGLGNSVRQMRNGGYSDDEDLPPVWPYGLAFNLALGVGSVAITAVRLRTPARKLATGVRVA